VRGTTREEVGSERESGNERERSSVWQEEVDREAQSLAGSVVSGFQLATAAGPLCEEPMRGLAFVVEAYLVPETSNLKKRPILPPHSAAATATGAPATAAQDGPDDQPVTASGEGTGEASAQGDGLSVTGSVLASNTVTGAGTGASATGVQRRGAEAAL